MVPPPETFAVTHEDQNLLDPATVEALSAPGIIFHPGLDLGAVFEAVAGDRDPSVFPDGKMLADSCPVRPLSEISTAFVVASAGGDFDAARFWTENFRLPQHSAPTASRARESAELDGYIRDMWGGLTYHVDRDEGSLLGTPYPHLKPGERFSEGCYWDLADGVSGLLVEARTDTDGDRQKKENLALGVAGNLVYQIEKYGYVPNGLRTYYLGRSQPPVFASIVKEMTSYFGERKPNLVEHYLPALTKEYMWWMQGEEDVAASKGPAVHRRVVLLPDGAVLNRHWDDNDTPRPESYREDTETALLAEGTDARTVFRNLRASAESGRDHTARFMTDPERLDTIHTTDFIPPELNSMLWEYETMIAQAHDRAGRSVLAEEFHGRADRRQAAIDAYLWNESDGCYYDYDFRKGEQSGIRSMGMAYPVARGAALPERGLRVAEVLQRDLLKRGGFISAAIDSPQQWDVPNGFARDQLEGINALLAVNNPGAAAIAAIAAERWLRSDYEIFSAHGVLVEKSDVMAPQARPGGGGEYPVQEGFLWTNGVHRVLQELLEASG